MTTLPIVVLTATRNRPALLRERFLPSVTSQTHRPDHLVLVDDSDRHQSLAVRTMAAEVERTGLPATYVPPADGPGLAAAWNRGLRTANARYPDAWIAGLDDDDWWLPDHIKQCVRTADENRADVVFARSVPVRDGIDQPRLDDGEPDLHKFLRGNPGFQGSTMFFRLSTILAIGGFDESMQSTLDRDLAVRLLVRGEARWAISQPTSVRFDVTADRARLSSAGCRRKQQGLDRFLEKHRHLMSEEDLRGFWIRARTLFGATGSLTFPFKQRHESD